MSEELLNEFAAWCEVAMLCDGGNIDQDGFLVAEGIGYDGLCSMLRFSKQIDRMERHETAARFRRLWWWPHTRKGWDSRATFAWRMAAECEREMNR